jgi:hypothetical protein
MSMIDMHYSFTDPIKQADKKSQLYNLPNGQRYWFSSLDVGIIYLCTSNFHLMVLLWCRRKILL